MGAGVRKTFSGKSILSLEAILWLIIERLYIRRFLVAFIHLVVLGVLRYSLFFDYFGDAILWRLDQADS